MAKMSQLDAALNELSAQAKEILETVREIRILLDADDQEEGNAHAETEFEKYRIIQDKLFQSDFDRFLAESEIK